MKNLNKDNFEEIIKTIHSVCVSISRTKNLRKNNNSNPQDTEAIYRDNIFVQLNSYPSSFENFVNCEANNNHGKTDIIIPFKNEKKYIAECATLKEKDCGYKIEKKYKQLIYNTTEKDNKISLIFFVLKREFKPNQILEEIEKIIKKQSNNNNFHNKQIKYKNSDWIIKTRVKQFPEIDFYIHIGVYNFFYDEKYSKIQK
ncbi:hypothetical protein LFWB_4630 [Candidatus Phytoplasma luffae]|uniref:Uncharacterized protein n=1 Tax=Loofah witches'-broom phytoplasma TaxID=35773 RepID=A0A975FJD0_LOWBP|nr:hypothetical protein [Candidatus Phytoplasma luffae]QTX02608.1 hypothetical protein LFWB_0380 [Candidatus Phytoplasma luffae]QTX03029.1 hypothetical protein LFWB_4630 [Candidatus Phytoplasma luffae]